MPRRKSSTSPSNPGDLVLDTLPRLRPRPPPSRTRWAERWIGIEMGEHARTHCLPRLLKVHRRRTGRHLAERWAGTAAAASAS
ncbi:MAG: hypothetical protein MZV65_25465 [Chromatiales bacterium]|nr:hypothetical protein [Chromatiales bacterium]